MAQEQLRREAEQIEPVPDLAKLGIPTFPEEAIDTPAAARLEHEVDHGLDRRLPVMGGPEGLGLPEALEAKVLLRTAAYHLAGDGQAVVLAGAHPVQRG